MTEEELYKEHCKGMSKCEAWSKRLGLDIEDLVWIVGCDDVKLINRHLKVFSVLPRCVRNKFVTFMSNHDIHFNLTA